VSLESIQASHNSFISNAGNISASNDPVQKPNDANELLIKGASAAAAGRELGLSEEETLAAVSRQYRKQGSKAAIRARRTQEAEAQRTYSQKQASLGNWSEDGELPGIRYEDDDENARAFGQDQSDFQNFTSNDRGFTEDEETGLLRRETFGETRGGENDFAPQNAVRDALTQLETASTQKDSLQQRLMGVFGGGDERQASIARVMGRLEDDLRPDSGADAALGSEAVRRDSKRFNPEMIEYNDNRAEAESQSIAREYFGGYGSGSMADDSIGRIAEIRSLGKIGETAHVVRTANDAIKGQATRRHDGVYLDPASGNPIAVQGPELPAVLAGDRTPNNASSSGALNAPQTAVSWVAESMPDYREGGRTFGDFPQVDITLQTTNFANRVRDYGERTGLPALTGVSQNIRSVDELQKVSSYIAGESAKAGRGLTIPDPQRPGKSLPAGNQTIAGVMNAVGMTQGEQQQFANAMFQLDAARRSSVNQNPTGTYMSRTGEPTKGVQFDAAEAINANEGSAKVARIPKGSTIRTGTSESGKPVRRSIVTQLAELDSPGAQKPFMGQVQGEKPRVNRMRPGGMGEGNELMSNIRRQAVARGRGKPIDEERVAQNQVKARLVEEREKRDSRKREEQRKQIQQYTPANLRQRGRYS
jgi:hypothetical protein